MYKVQGETLNSLIIARWRDSKFYSKQQAYICVSRVTTGDSFASMDTFTDKHIEQFKPPDHTHIEDKRLRQLSKVFLESDEVKELFEENYDLSHKHQDRDNEIEKLLYPSNSSLRFKEYFRTKDSPLQSSSDNITFEPNVSESESSNMNQRFSKLCNTLKSNTLMTHSNIEVIFKCNIIIRIHDCFIRESSRKQLIVLQLVLHPSNRQPLEKENPPLLQNKKSLAY
jgi:hypothetical protein